ncbi:helix-turn-helix domain-containing protein [Enterococcus sp. BWB1-3]|uniref:helix-turn-helix transcriptional regulator n=1 Tax=unclassified Enterococcus TaxID=2608891 RepID=UPI001924A9AC|nr:MULTISPECIES: helix-turn-helix domain-containing protein [unclassified Enterococcus]MBL1229394.1 helix-turn-helix domain-containing protein [Enterococcus sp. BWB1-3]MCB5956078.1 helix-turn-helix domain-containing protein [Enterococcus sp. CWB-B31]
MEIGVKLREIRNELRLTQEQVAASVHVSRQTISSWENGHSYPDIISVLLLSELYNVSVDTLLKGDPKMTSFLKESTDTVKSNRRILYGMGLNLLLIILMFFFEAVKGLAFLLFILIAVNGAILFYNFVRKI